jgi:type I restriction enzyme M protein
MTAATPQGMKRYSLGELLQRRRELIVPAKSPDREFQTLTLTQEGRIEPREAGQGNSPPAWFGAYFKDDAKWFVVRKGDLLFSRIDIWKGSVSIVPEEFDGAIVTQEFPVYEVHEELIDRHYLRLLLRTPYFRRAIRAITTGHSNRRRTQDEDFEALEVCLPDKPIQHKIAELVQSAETKSFTAERDRLTLLGRAEEVIMGKTSPATLGITVTD